MCPSSTAFRISGGPREGAIILQLVTLSQYPHVHIYMSKVRIQYSAESELDAAKRNKHSHSSPDSRTGLISRARPEHYIPFSLQAQAFLVMKMGKTRF